MKCHRYQHKNATFQLFTANPTHRCSDPRDDGHFGRCVRFVPILLWLAPLPARAVDWILGWETFFVKAGLSPWLLLSFLVWFLLLLAFLSRSGPSINVTNNNSDTIGIQQRQISVHEHLKLSNSAIQAFNLLLLRLRFSFFTFLSLSSRSRSRSLG